MSGPSYRVPFRRKRKGKTDYRLRKRLISSGKPRLVMRTSLKHTIAQIVEAKPEGDRMLATAHSTELTKKYRWLGSCGNLPAAYLTGLLAGHRALLKGTKEAVLDIGLSTPSKGSRLFAGLKGASDSGLQVSHNAGVLPDESRIRGEHIANYAKQLLSANPELYQLRFARYLGQKLKPESLPEHFEKVKSKILGAKLKGGRVVKTLES